MIRCVAFRVLIAFVCLLPSLSAQESGGSVSGFYGSFSTEVPIAVPAYHGLEPDLKLSYHSGGNASWIGQGWSLKGLSFIERAAPGGGAPHYDGSDAFFMDGVELVPSTLQGGTHCTKIMNYARIQQTGSTWTVTGTNGNRAVYHPLFTTTKGTFRWYLTSVTDPRGNRIDYGYTNDNGREIYLDTISYNGTVVRFYRASRPDVVTFATGAEWGETRERLCSIDITVGGSRARAYKITHRLGKNTGRSLIESVTQYGRDASLDATGQITGGSSLPPMTFDWMDDTLGAIYITQGTAPTSGWNAGYAWGGDYNGDGLNDVLSYSSGWFTTFFANGDGTYEEVKGSAPTGGWDAGRVWTGDFNGDGLSDILSYYGGYLTSFLANGNGGYSVVKTQSNTSWHSGYAWSGDYDNDGRTDLLSYYSGWFTTFRANSNGGFTILKGQAPTGGWNAGLVWKGDYNGDGRSDILSYHGGYLTTFTSNGNGTYNTVKTHANTSWHSSYAWPGDYDGDGRTDLMSYYSGWFTTFKAGSNGSFTIQKGSAPTSGWDAGRVWRGDFNGDGRADIRSYYGGLMATFVSGGNGTYTHLSQKVPGSGWHSGYVWPGEYDGDGRTDLLSYHEGRFTTFHADGSNRGAIDTTQTTAPTSGWHSDYVWQGDFTGDGKGDILSYYGGTFTTFATQGNGTYSVLKGSAPTTGWHSSYAWSGDYDGDGDTDLLSYYSGWFTTFISAGNGTYTVLKGSAPTSGWDAGRVWPGDYDADGKVDLMSYAGGYLTTFFSNGDGTYRVEKANVNGIVWDAGRVWPGDYNGDGKADILSYYSGKFTTFFANGDGSVTHTTETAPTTGWHSGYAWRGDYNGDGKADLMSYYSGWFTTFLSDGNGVYRIEKDPAPTSAWNAGYVWPGDYNGDGRTDLLSYHEGHMTTFSSQGDGTYFTNKVAVTTSNWNAGRVWPNDYDGDGKPDLLSYHGGTFTTFFSAGKIPDRLIGLENGNGGLTEVEYLPSTAWNNTYLPPGMILHTVSKLTTHDGRGNSSTTDYTYQGGLWSPAERRFLGFRKVTAVTDAQGNYAETWYYQKVGSISKPEYTYFKDNQGNIYSYSAYTYTENTTAPYTSLLTSRWDYEMNLGTQSRRKLVQFAYDTYGNVTHVFDYGDYDLNGDEKTIRRGYMPNTSLYITGLPAYENTHEGIGIRGNLVQQHVYHYDGNGSYTEMPTKGLMTRVRKWDSTTGGHTSATMTYDAWGNVISQTDERGAVTTTSFDSTYHLYPVGATNAAGHSTTSSYDPVLGLETANVDENGALTQFGYDVFGRPTHITWPDGAQTTYAYLNWGDAQNQHIVESSPDGSGNGLWRATWQDGLGRTWKTQKEGGVTVETIFSGATSRVWKRSLPFRTGETKRWTVFTYDGMGRQRTVTHPDGAWSETIYANDANGKPYKAIYDENGNERLHWTDSNGKLTRVREKNYGGYHYTDYQYDVLGRLTAVIDDMGNTTSIVWDSLGRKQMTIDPDTGVHTYDYDNGGLPIRETDGQGRVTTFTYDALGRMTTRINADGDRFDWYYDENGYGASIGRLTSTSFPDGSTSHYWDIRGNETTTTRCFQGNCRTMDTDFDSMGRVDSITYPGGDVVNYTYDAEGQLASVPGYVDSFDWDASGQLTQMTYANGVTSTFNFDANRRWLNGAEVTGPGGVQLYQAGYQYDDRGRVTLSHSATHGLLNMNYSYDNLDRLTAVSGGQNQTLSYNAIGGITYNSKVGNYSHGDAAHKHAVTKAGGANLTYDASGNLLSDGQRTFNWNADNLLESVTKAGQTTWFRYDAGGQRLYKSGPSGSVIYFNALIENVDGVDVNYIMAGPMLVAKKTARVTTWFHADRLGSVRLMTNALGREVQSYEYDAWGKMVSASGSADNERGFTGHYLDEETGLIYMNARYYDPELGRFISPDSVVPEPGNPQALDRYAYAYNNPVSNIDPTGHAVVVAALATVSASIAAVSAGAGSWLAVTAVVGAGLSIAGYYTKNPLLSTIGGVMLGFAGGFAATGMISQGVLGATVAAATSPLSPLGDGLKQAIGWAYTAYGLFRGMGSEFKKGQLEAPKGYEKGFIETLDGGRVSVYKGVGPYKAIYKVTGVTTGEAPTAWGNLGDNLSDIVTNIRGGMTPSANAILEHMSTNGYLPSEVLGIGHSLGSWDLITLANSGHMTNVIGYGVPHEALIQVIHAKPNPGLNMTLAVGWADYVSLPRIPSAVGSSFAGVAAKAAGTNGLSFGVANTGFGWGAHMQPNYYEAVGPLLGQ